MSPPVAIVGMACRFPDAPNPHILWQNILNRRSSFRKLENQRWDHSRFYHPSNRNVDKTHAETAAQIADVEYFAGPYFGIAPRRAEAMDPQQRVVLECVYQALQDAGLERRPWDRQRSAAFIGACTCEYKQLNVVRQRAAHFESGAFGAPFEVPAGSAERALPMRSYTFPGSMTNVIASGVAQAFDLGGPAYTIDAACASAHVAISQAMAYLAEVGSAEGPAPVVLVGGVYLNLLPEVLVGFARTGALSRRDCRPFDAAADGFVLGEGAGILVIKGLEQAKRDGDRIYAVVRGVAVNSDGRNSNPLGPRLEGQIAALRQCLEVTGVTPAAIGYVECHGTGTPTGDAGELKALTEIFGDHPCRLGAIKANIGHALSACGIAGTIRAVLALYHEVLPPQAGFDSWHPSLEVRGANFRFEQEALSWSGGTRMAMVNAFAFGGTNGIAILENAPPCVSPTVELGGTWLFCFSAPTPELLEEYRRDWLASARGQSLSSLAYTQTMTRLPHRYGCVVVAENLEQLAAPAPILPLQAGPIHVPGMAPGDRAWLQERGVALAEEGAEFLSLSHLHVLGWAHLCGQTVELSDLFPDRRLADIPPIPLVRHPYWIIQPEAAQRSLATAGNS